MLVKVFVDLGPDEFGPLIWSGDLGRGDFDPGNLWSLISVPVVLVPDIQITIT